MLKDTSALRKLGKKSEYMNMLQAPWSIISGASCRIRVGSRQLQFLFVRRSNLKGIDYKIKNRFRSVRRGDGSISINKK